MRVVALSDYEVETEVELISVREPYEKGWYADRCALRILSHIISLAIGFAISLADFAHLPTWTYSTGVSSPKSFCARKVLAGYSFGVTRSSICPRELVTETPATETLCACISLCSSSTLVFPSGTPYIAPDL